MVAHHILFLWLRPRFNEKKKALHVDGASKVHGEERVQIAIQRRDLGVGLANGLELFQETNLLQQTCEIGAETECRA